jgi:hypothetical protein
MNVSPCLRVQGRTLSGSDLAAIQQLIDQHPHWSRHAVARELCRLWEWRTAVGQAKTFAARSLLLTLAQRHGLRLPPVRVRLRRRPWGLRPGGAGARPPQAPRTATLQELGSLQWQGCAHRMPQRERALDYLRHHHYLGCNRPVGAHLLYLVQDAQGHDLAVHLVGAAAWHCAPAIGISAGVRRPGAPIWPG